MGQQLRPVIRGRLAKNLLEHAVEMRERLEAHLKRNFTDAQIRVEQEILGFLDAHAGDVIGKIDAGDLLEHFAEVIAAHVHGLGDLAEGKFFGLVLLDEGAGLGNDRGLGILALDEHLIAHHGQMLRKN